MEWATLETFTLTPGFLLTVPAIEVIYHTQRENQILYWIERMAAVPAIPQSLPDGY